MGVLNREYMGCFGGRGMLEMIKLLKSNGTKIVCIPSKSLGNQEQIIMSLKDKIRDIRLNGDSKGK